MASPEDQAAERRRRGYWIQRARKRKGFTLDYVAQMMGYSGKSLSTPSLWESGKRPVPSDKLGPLARLLDLPPDFLVSPQMTDDERLDAAVRDAEALERQDSERVSARRPQAAVVRAVGPRRRSA